MTSRRRAPKCPYELGPAGTAWWKWAWKTQQSEKWDTGAHYTVARRALLEDDRRAAVLADDEGLLEALLEGAEPDAIRTVKYALTRLASSASGAAALSREMRELETQLGLGPKATAAAASWQSNTPTKPTGDGLDDLARRRDARRAGASAAEGPGRP